jgi:hypothetical protein
MPRFNLEDYETVEERIKRFYALHEDGRITTDWNNDFETSSPRTWVVKASVYITAGDQANNLPKATGYAFEIDGTGGANQTSALENAETSAIGRALANMNLSGNRRASRQEMEKVERGSVAKDWLKEADKVMSIDAMRWLYAQAKDAGATTEVLEGLADRARVLSPEGQDSGAGGSVPTGNRKGPAK